MSFLSRLNPFRRESRSNLRDPAQWLYDALAGGKTAAGVSVNEKTAMTLAAVWAAVRVLAEGEAALPFPVYARRGDGGKERQRNNPVHFLLNAQANPDMTAVVFRETLMGHLLLWGNGYAEIEWAGNNRPMALWPITPDRVAAVRANDGTLRYEVRNDTRPPTTLEAWQVLHIPGLSFDGVCGYSPIRMARRSLSIPMAAEEFGGAFFGNGARPSGVLEAPAGLSDKARESLRKSWQQYQGADNAGKTALLEEGIKYHQLTIPPEDAKFIETRTFGVQDVARWFKVPAHMLAELSRATFSNIEHQGIEFVVHSLRPWLVRWEQEVNRKLFGVGSDVFAEHSVDALLRGDTLARYQAYNLGINSGWLTRNEVRGLENLNPIDGLDEPLTPLNMAAGPLPIPPEATNGNQSQPGTVQGGAGEGSARGADAGERRAVDAAPVAPPEDAEGGEAGHQASVAGGVRGDVPVSGDDAPGIGQVVGTDAVDPEPPATVAFAPSLDAARAATRTILTDATRRMMKRLTTHARKNAGTDWIAEHRAVVHEAMNPAVVAYAAVCGLEKIDAAERVNAFLDTFKSDVAAAGAGLDDTLDLYDEKAAEHWVSQLENPDHAPAQQ